MATLKTPVPAPSASQSAGLSPNSIADAGAGLIRLWVAAITLPLTAINAFGTGFTRLIASVTAALDGTAGPQGSSNEIVKATSDLVGATAKLYISLLNATVSSLDAATRAINTAAADSSTPPRK
jgi:hypothetical protein